MNQAVVFVEYLFCTLRKTHMILQLLKDFCFTLLVYSMLIAFLVDAWLEEELDSLRIGVQRHGQWNQEATLGGCTRLRAKVEER